jgi:hypothetical protein
MLGMVGRYVQGTKAEIMTGRTSPFGGMRHLTVVSWLALKMKVGSVM